MLGLALKGVAQSVLTSLNFNQRQNYVELVQGLKQKFNPSEQVQIYLTKVKSRKSKAQEPVTELGQYIHRLAQMAYPQADQVTLD